ncbi:hypothetical protein HKD37_20G055807 [Glycine soja]
MNGNATVWFVTIFEILRCPYSWSLIEDFRALLEHKISCSSFLSLHSSPSSSKLLSMASYGGTHMGHLRFVILFGRNNQHENTEKGVEEKSLEFQEPRDLRSNPFQGGGNDAILPRKGIG